VTCGVLDSFPRAADIEPSCGAYRPFRYHVEVAREIATYSESPVSDTTIKQRQRTVGHLRHAVHKHQAWSRSGLQERMFTLAFRNLVYPQIWEDPVIDMEALAIRPEDHIVTITSGGCNVFSYLSASPARITALDLNSAHIALNRLKLVGLEHLPNHAALFDFFGRANLSANISAYRTFIQPHLDATSRRYWEGRSLSGRRRIGMFTRGFYRYGLLGRFIGAAHMVARLHGCDPRAILSASDRAEQRRIFDTQFVPAFSRPLVRWLTNRPSSLYGLGIPPAQYHALAGDGEMADVLLQRLEKLACGFDIQNNYFAWQAFGRGYQDAADPSVPPYLERSNYDTIRGNLDRVDVRHQSMTEFLQSSAPASVDCVVLLDAQDWMDDRQLTDLWRAIDHAARPGARVIFRTAADEPLLPGRIPGEILARWSTDPAECRAWNDRDRSSVYGMFHLYRLTGELE